MSFSLDHIGLVGPHLAALEATYARLGFRVAPRCELLSVDAEGGTTPMGQSNSHLIFGDTYVELTAVEGEIAGHHLERAISRYWGLHIIVMRSADAEADQQALARAGSLAPDVARAARHVAYPDASGTARFKWFRIPEAEFPDAFLCMVQHLDAGLVFNAALNTHPNGARDLRAITLLSDDPARTAGRLAGVSGARAAEMSGGWAGSFANARLLVLGPEEMAARYPGVALPGSPWFAGFTVASDDLEATAAYFAASGIPARREAGRLWLDPAETGGAIIEFVRA